MNLLYFAHPPLFYRNIIRLSTLSLIGCLFDTPRWSYHNTHKQATGYLKIRPLEKERVRPSFFASFVGYFNSNILDTFRNAIGRFCQEFTFGWQNPLSSTALCFKNDCAGEHLIVNALLSNTISVISGPIVE